MFGLVPFGIRPFGVGKAVVSVGAYIYFGSSLRVSRYLGTKTDAQLYLGTKTGVFSA